MTQVKILLLGGTQDARELAGRLARHEKISLVTSLAGRTADPLLPAGAVRQGGFGGISGLAAYLRDKKIDAVIDATHPFAAQMSFHAAEACAQTDTRLVMLERPQWRARTGDRWIDAADMNEAVKFIADLGRRVFLTIGRQELAVFSAAPHFFLIRSIDPPEDKLPANHHLLLARGPFSLADEIELLREHAIDVLVTKNSGGDATHAKLEAARQLRMPVVMVSRPPRPAVDTVDTVDAAVGWVFK